MARPADSTIVHASNGYVPEELISRGGVKSMERGRKARPPTRLELKPDSRPGSKPSKLGFLRETRGPEPKEEV